MAINVNGAEVGSSSTRARQLQITSGLEVEFEVVLETTCSGTDCEDPAAIETIANSVHDSVEEAMSEAVNDGSFVQSLQGSSPEAATLFEGGELHE